MGIKLAVLSADDAEAHWAGEDEETVRWLTGGYGSIEGTQDYFRMLADNARAGRGKRGFGVWLDGQLAGYVDSDPDLTDGQLAGYVDSDPDLTDGLEEGDVNISFGVHPWARGHGLAGEAVRLMCDFLRGQRLGAGRPSGSSPRTSRRSRWPRRAASPSSVGSSQQQTPTPTGRQPSCISTAATSDRPRSAATERQVASMPL